MTEITNVLVSRASPEEREALARFIREERPDLGERDAWRELAREQLIALGLLPLGEANRGRAAGDKL